MGDSRHSLEREARYFHGLFFREELAPQVVERYVAANQLCFPQLEDRDQKMLEDIVGRQMDAEAIELALRIRHCGSVLTRKIQILFYLVEVRSQYYGRFVNQESGILRAVARLTGAIACTIWKLTKGLYLTWKYEYV